MRSVSIPRTNIQETHSFFGITKATKLLNHNDNVEMNVCNKGHKVDTAVRRKTTVQLMKCPRKVFLNSQYQIGIFFYSTI